MALQLLEMKADINAVLSESGIDTLLVSEWTKLEEMTNLLAPFSTQTDILQSNLLSLSLILPSLMDLECHLQQLSNSTSSSEPLTMLADLRSRFSSLLCRQPLHHRPMCSMCSPSVAGLQLAAETDCLKSGDACVSETEQCYG